MTAEQIKAWLLLVHEAQLAVTRVQENSEQVPGVDAWDVNRAAENLRTTYEAGLEAFGRQVLNEYLDAKKAQTVA